RAGYQLHLIPIRRYGKQPTVNPDGAILQGKRHPTLAMCPNRLKVDVLAKYQPACEVVALQLQEALNDPLDSVALGGRWEIARFHPLVLARLHVVLEDRRPVTERRKRRHDRIQVQAVRQRYVNSRRGMAGDQWVRRRQLVANAVSPRRVDELDIQSQQRLV